MTPLRLIMVSVALAAVALMNEPLRVTAAECTEEELAAVDAQKVEDNATACEESGTISSQSGTVCTEECINYLEKSKAMMPNCTAAGVDLSAALEASIEFCKSDQDDIVSDPELPLEELVGSDDGSSGDGGAGGSPESTPDDAYMLAGASATALLCSAFVGVTLAA